MSTPIQRRLATFLLSLAVAAAATNAALAQKKYDTGASDTEIKIGNFVPYSGPASAYGVIGKAMAAVLQEGQRRGRHQRPQDQLHLLRRRLQPAEGRRAGPQAGRERRGAAACSARSAPPSNTAIQKYVNSKKVPQLFVATGATKWNDPKNFPWTMGWLPSYQSEVADLREVPHQGKARRPRSPCSIRTTIWARTI